MPTSLATNPYESPVVPETEHDPDAVITRCGNNWLIRYEIQEEDHVNFKMDASKKNRIHPMFYWLGYAAFSMPLSFSPVVRGNLSWLMMLTILVGIGLVVAVAQYFLVINDDNVYRKLFRRQVREEHGGIIAGWCELETCETGLRIRSPASEIRYAWTGLHHIETTEKYCYLYLTTITAEIIPARAFRDPHDFAAFVATLQQYFAMASCPGAAAIPSRE